jgi:hypothetical protein
MYFLHYDKALLTQIEEACSPSTLLAESSIVPSEEEIKRIIASEWEKGTFQAPMYDRMAITIDADGNSVSFSMRRKISRHIDYKSSRVSIDASAFDADRLQDPFTYREVTDLARVDGCTIDEVKRRFTRAIAKSDSIKKLVQFSTDNVVTILHPTTGEPEFRFQLPSSDPPAVPRPPPPATMPTGSNPLQNSGSLSSSPSSSPGPLSGRRIALDPALLSGSIDVDGLESETMGGKRTGLLNLHLALVLKYKLELLGADILMSRAPGRMSSGQTWQSWCDAPSTRKLYAEWVEMSRQNLHEYYDKLMASMDSGDPSVFVRECQLRILKQLDRTTRSVYLNALTPDVSIHWCFGPADRHQKSFFACTPGSFCDGELVIRRSRVDFTRLLLTRSIDRSERLCTSLALQLERDAFLVPRANAEIERWLMPLGHPGVKARNLQVPREVRSPSAYLSLLYPLNDEATLLELTTFDQVVHISPTKTLKTSAAICVIAERLAEGLVDYFTERTSPTQSDEKRVLNTIAVDTPPASVQPMGVK